MEDRAKRARRLLDVMTQLHQIEEQKKLLLQRRYDELQQTQDEVINALNTDDALCGLFIDTTARFLKSLALEAKRVAQAQDRQEERLLDQAVKVKSAEKLKDTLERHTARSRSEKELRELIERHVARNIASLP